MLKPLEGLSFVPKMNSIHCVKKKIESIIALSDIPEDPIHSSNTCEWVVRLDPAADESLQIAALGHDIERAVKDRKILQKDYKDYDQFKEAHAMNSMVILKEIMNECGLDEKMVKDICKMVHYHEVGYNKKTNLLQDADTLSFFEVNLPFYYARNNKEEIKRRCLWGLKRLSLDLRHIVSEFKYKDKEIETLVKLGVNQFS